jgi:hypothetical protein
MENEMTVSEGMEIGLAAARNPIAILTEAKERAKALKDLVSKKTKPVIMNGEQYLEFEDWQTCGKFYNVAAKVVSTEYIEIGGAQGFKAKAVIVDTRTGIEISAAEAICLNDEDKWSTRKKYNSKREEIGTVPVPKFQLMSMAQTRACAKGLRNVLAWVVVLAGYNPTVAEEMTGDEQGHHEPINPPQAKEKPDAPMTGKAEFVPLDVRVLATGKSAKGPWTLHAILKDEKTTYTTFNDQIAAEAEAAKNDGFMVTILSHTDAKGRNAIDHLTTILPTEK